MNPSAELPRPVEAPQLKEIPRVKVNVKDASSSPEMKRKEDLINANLGFLHVLNVISTLQNKEPNLTEADMNPNKKSLLAGRLISYRNDYRDLDKHRTNVVESTNQVDKTLKAFEGDNNLDQAQKSEYQRLEEIRQNYLQQFEFETSNWLYANGYNPSNTKFEVMDIDDPDSFMKKLGAINHDITNILQPFGFLDLLKIGRLKPERLPTINNVKGNLAEFLDIANMIIKNEVPQELIGTQEYVEEGQSDFAKLLQSQDPPMTFRVETIPAELKDVKFIGSKYLRKLLEGNLLQNAIKAFDAFDQHLLANNQTAKPRVLSLKIQQSLGEPDCIEVIYENEGLGFPKHLTEIGEFQRAFSEWQGEDIKGTGYGMYSHDFLVRHTLGGKLIPRNRVEIDPKTGERKVFAQVVLRLPKSKSQIPTS